jgi:uncharacterized protein (DUF4415 family)
MKNEYDFSKLKLKRKGPLPALKGKSPDSARYRVTISLSSEVVNYFKEQAKKPGAIPYQTQINQALMQLIEERQSSRDRDSELESLKDKLLHDKAFIKKISNALKPKHQ